MAILNPLQSCSNYPQEKQEKLLEKEVNPYFQPSIETMVSSCALSAFRPSEAATGFMSMTSLPW